MMAPPSPIGSARRFAALCLAAVAVYREQAPGAPGVGNAHRVEHVAADKHQPPRVDPVILDDVGVRQCCDHPGRTLFDIDDGEPEAAASARQKSEMVAIRREPRAEYVWQTEKVLRRDLRRRRSRLRQCRARLRWRGKRGQGRRRNSGRASAGLR